MKDKLFELIREEKIILFAGAGTSMSAGYPSGAKLRDILYSNLKSSEKKLIDKNLPLANFAEEFCKIKDDKRKTLNNILLNQFHYYKPKSISWHKNLSQIAHIRTIITTNYDELFEKGYAKKAKLIFNSTHVSDGKSNHQTEIYKIHGHLSNLNTVILTSSDYNNFFKNNSETNVFWSSVKTKMASNNILFIGYNLEDPNINLIFDKIYDEVGELGKEHFFLAPNVPEYKISYLRNKGINYINMKSESFLKELKNNLYQNIVNDFNQQKIKEGTFIEYSKNYGMMPKFISQKDKLKVVDFKGIKKPIERKITLKFSGDLQKEIAEYISGKNFGNFDIPKEKILSSSVNYGNFLVSKDNLKMIRISPVPDIDTFVDIRFENSVEYSDIKVELFKRENYAKITAKFKNSTVTFNFDFTKQIDSEFQFTLDHNEICGNLKSEIEEMEVFHALGNGKRITVFARGYQDISDQLPINNDIVEFTEAYIKYFKALKEIENHYSVKFENIDFASIDDKKSKLIEVIIASINGTVFIANWNAEFKVSIDDTNRDKLKKLILNDSKSPSIPHTQEDNVELYGINFNLGYRVTTLIDCYLYNKEEIEKDTGDFAIFKSKTNKIAVTWTRKLIVEKENIII